eukprot:3639795-Rhodomonas_salina.1
MVLCSVPHQLSGTVRVVVEKWNQGNGKGVFFRFAEKYSLTSLLPSRGPMQGGTVVTVEAGGMLVLPEVVHCVFDSTTVAGQ